MILEPRPHRAHILTTTRIGLTAAEQLFGDSGAILLEDEEYRRWESEIYTNGYEGFWWWTHTWWSLVDESDEEGFPIWDGEYIRSHYPLPAGCSHWIVNSGVVWGPLAGGANHDLWRWNGEKAEFIECYCIDTY